MKLNVGCIVIIPFAFHCCYPPIKKECKELGPPGFAMDEVEYLKTALEVYLNRTIKFNVVQIQDGFINLRLALQDGKRIFFIQGLVFP